MNPVREGIKWAFIFAFAAVIFGGVVAPIGGAIFAGFLLLGDQIAETYGVKVATLYGVTVIAALVGFLFGMTPDFMPVGRRDEEGS